MKKINLILFCWFFQFLPDANHVMQLLLKTQTEIGSSVEAEDPQVLQ